MSCRLGLLCIAMLLSSATAYAVSTFANYGMIADRVSKSTSQSPQGMEFDVNQPVVVTSLGAFDGGGLGWTADARIVVTLFNRVPNADGKHDVMARMSFGHTAPGVLDDSSRFKTLQNPLRLDKGFQGILVAWGEGAADPKSFLSSRLSMVPDTWCTDDGGGALSFVGISHDSDGYTYSERANRYAAGNFQFQSVLGPDPATPPVPEPLTLLTGLMVVSGLGAYIRRRTRAAAKA